MRQLRPLAFFCLCLLALPGAASAEVRLKGRELSNCILRVSPGLLDKAVAVEKSLEAGLESLSSLFDRPALSAKPEFWLVATADELDVVLAQFFKLPEAQRKQAVKVGAFRDAARVAIVVDPQIPDDWLLRLLYTEHARSLLDAVAPSARSLRIGWFYAGAATYMAWMVAGEQAGDNLQRSRLVYLQYYSRFFEPDKFLPLQLLEVPADWNGALQRRGSAAYAQAALTVWFLVELKSPRAVVTIAKSYEREEAFSTAFERGAGITLKEFEKQLVLKLFPEVRKMRGEPAKGEPSKVEPGKVEPGKDEPGKDEPGKDEPSKDEPGKDEPGKVEPGKVEPGKVEPGKVEPGKDEPSKG